MKYWGIPLAALLLAAACAPSPEPERRTGASIAGQHTAPPGAAPGTCWGRKVRPAIIETVTEQVATGADETGSPVRYRTETRQEIVREREVRWFQAPCREEITPDLIASLQRALRARDFYRGEITGRIDAATEQAIRHYQRRTGLDSPVLSLKTARALGLIAVARPDAAPADD